ncbi:MAG: bifunctional metallophosphatase/5'-nucleotidase [Elusimicrobia bacterium]|nr:bifunctional metallophosphatase/5'-nucleotidase [Elusimicrobiota bacterium]
MGKSAIRFLALWLLLLAGASGAESLKIFVYHTNDIHGWIRSRPASFYQADPSRLIGGAAVLSNVLKKEAGPKLLIDAGDWFQGTPEGSLSRGESAVEIFNALGYDAVAVGNHDFDFGEARLKELSGMAKIPVLAANIYRKDGQRVAYLKPWIVKEVAGVKVGIFGLTTTHMRQLTFPENFAGLEFRREVEAAREAVKALRARGATVIIAATHVGFESPDMGPFEGDQTVASQVEGIDLIVGGHTHTPLRVPVRDATYGTLITQAGSTLSQVGRVTLEIDPKTKKVAASRGELLDLWADEWGEDPGVLALSGKYESRVKAIFDVVVATAAARLSRNREGESSLGDWMTDCERSWARADIAFQNGGGIRADLEAGPVTVRDIFNVMPFDNYVVRLSMKGALVREILDYGVGRSKGMLQVSGVEFSYDRDGAQGRRAAAVLVGGRPLDDEASYEVATIDFMVKGGDGYTPFALAQKQENTKTLLRDVLRECARKQGLIAVPSGGRLRSGPGRGDSHGT